MSTSRSGEAYVRVRTAGVIGDRSVARICRGSTTWPWASTVATSTRPQRQASTGCPWRSGSAKHQLACPLPAKNLAGFLGYAGGAVGELRAGGGYHDGVQLPTDSAVPGHAERRSRSRTASPAAKTYPDNISLQSWGILWRGSLSASATAIGCPFAATMP